MDLESLTEFIRMHKESLERDKRELKRKNRQKSPRSEATDVLPDEPRPNDRLVPTLTTSPEPIDLAPIPANDCTPTQQLTQDKDMLRYHNRQSQFHRPQERRALTAGEVLPSKSSSSQAVSESFYNYFPSLNTKKQQVLEERRQEYFEYLKNKTTPTTNNGQGDPEMIPTESDSVDELRKYEKERLAVQFQKSKQKSILNYQIVEDRNRRVEEEAQLKKQEYYNELKKQIEETKKRQEAQKRLEKLEDDIIDRKIQLDEQGSAPAVRKYSQPVQYQPPPQQPTNHQPVPLSDTQYRKLKSNRDFEETNYHHNQRPPLITTTIDDKENVQYTYNYFSNSAKESRQQVAIPGPVATSTADHKQCCESYKQILEKLETLCRWRDDFVAQKRNTRVSGCVLCDSGSLKMCNFCDYHEGVIKERDERYEEDVDEDSFTDSEEEYRRYHRKTRKALPRNKQYKMIANRKLVDMLTPQVAIRERTRVENDKEEEFHPEPIKDFRNNSFVNFDDIPLPTQRRSIEPVVARRSEGFTTEESDMPESRKRLNEMKKVEWKWDIPAVQKHSITRDKPDKVLTQLGAIRKQLQMEQLNVD